MTQPATPPAAGPAACSAAAFTHPLELIPLFRRWPRSFLRDVLYTFIWNTLLAIILTALAVLFNARMSTLTMFKVNLLFANCIGFTIVALFMLGDLVVPRIHAARVPIRFAYYTLLPIAGVIIGYWVGAAILGFPNFIGSVFTPRGIGSIATVSLIISAILLTIFIQRERAARTETAVAHQQARVAAAERETALAQMKALQAQVEPHFLYNTLAHVASLIDSAPTQARAMLDRLIVLLRATAKASNGGATLGGQADLLRAYLDILAVRMERRLVWTIDVPSTLADAQLPPALLQPLSPMMNRVSRHSCATVSRLLGPSFASWDWRPTASRRGRCS